MIIELRSVPKNWFRNLTFHLVEVHNQTQQTKMRKSIGVLEVRKAVVFEVDAQTAAALSATAERSRDVQPQVIQL